MARKLSTFTNFAHVFCAQKIIIDKYSRIVGMELAPFEIEEVDVAGATDVGLPAKVILYNDDWHTFDEVIGQIIKAVGCSHSKAEQHTIEVHETGKSCVYQGEMGKCLGVSAVLEEIALNTEVEL